MEVNEQLVRAVTQAVVAQLMASGAQPQNVSSTPAPAGTGSFAGKTRMRPKHSYEGAVRASKGTDPKEVVIGVGAAFQTEITKTMSGIPLEEVLRNICAGIEEEGMTSRVVKVLDTSDVGFMGLEAAKLSGCTNNNNQSLHSDFSKVSDVYRCSYKHKQKDFCRNP